MTVARRPSGPGVAARAVVLAVATAVVASCGGGEHEYEPPDRSRQIAAAESTLARVDFDTIRWRSDSLRLYTGNELYAAECRQCHGYLGRGDTEYARRRDLQVPSLVERDWRLAQDPDSIRRIVYVGHVGGMPSWGAWRLSPRAIDAITFYLLHQLRPEVLGEEAAGTGS